MTNIRYVSLMIIVNRAPGSDWAEFDRVLCPLAKEEEEEEEEEEVKVSCAEKMDLVHLVHCCICLSEPMIDTKIIYMGN